MKQSLWRKFPKWVLALSIVVVSTALFAFWYFFLYPRWWGNGGGSNSSVANTPSAPSPPEPSEWDRRRERAALLPSRMAGLVVAGNDLYDVVGCEVVFKNWLQGGCPPAIYYDAANQRIIGKVERGLIRYELTGQKEKTMGEPYGAAFTDGHRLAIFAKNGDVWKAEPDWASFTLTKELQVTKIGEFREAFLIQNIMMGNEELLLVRQPPNLLSVNMKNGEVHPLRLPPGSKFQNQSPDGAMLVGLVRERAGPSFYAYEAAKDNAETFPLGRNGALNGVLWLDKDRCAVLLNGNILKLYDRKRNKLDDLIIMATPCQGMIGPSPTGKRFWCGSNRGAKLLVDVEKKECELFPHAAEFLGWISDDVFAFSNDLPDTSVRGTYLVKVGSEPRRISEEPFLGTRDGRTCLEYLKEGDQVVFGTKSGLYRMNSEGSEFKQVAGWLTPNPVLLRIDNWPPK